MPLLAWPQIGVEPGTSRVRLYYDGVGATSSDGLNGADRYRVGVVAGRAHGATGS